jgi:copper transport protein
MSLHQFSADMSVSLLFQFASRWLWYLIVLTLAGWLMWGIIFKAGENARQSITRMTINLQRIHIFALVLMILTHLEELLDGGGLEELLDIFLSTSVGIGWLVLLLLSIIGIYVLTRLPWLTGIWVTAYLLVSSLYGHSSTGDPQWLTMTLGFIHLTAAAVLVGGLLYGLKIRREQSEEFGPFIHRFLLVAIASIVVLAITGLISTVLLLPSMTYLFSTQWGILLMVKVGITLLFACLLIIIGLKQRGKQEQSIVQLLKVNVSLTVVMVLIIGCITYMSPTPANKPLFWHEMGETVHMSARINPLYVGPNTFRAKIWVSENEQAPKQVSMQLHSLDRQDQAPIEIHLAPHQDQKKEADFEGFKEYSYLAEDERLPFSGSWRLEVHVERATGEMVKYEKVFKLN